MRSFLHHAWRFLTKDDGPTTTEYAVLIVLIVFVCFAVIMLIGSKVDQTFETVDAGVPGGN